jgi:SAM-dependent methyltransferase
MLQDNIFLQSEGDRWFARNRDALGDFDANADLSLRLMDLYGLRPGSVLEIGAASGFRLAVIQRRTAARCVAVEPSIEAVRAGKTSFPFVTFVRGTADSIPLQDRYDLVIVNFVFHWIDRLTLLRSVAEVDRLVSDRGFLIVGDFLPANRTRAPYHHLKNAEVYTYKQDYSELFRTSGLYHPIGLLTAHHETKRLDPAVDEHERIGAWLLRKEMRRHYFETGVNVHGA